MMGDHRFGLTTKGRKFHGLNTIPDLDILVNSESPQIQELRLYKELNRELEKNSDRLRYVESDIYARVRERSPIVSGPSEIQSATVNVGLSPKSSRINPSETNNVAGSNKRSETSHLSSSSKTPREDEEPMDFSDPNHATLHQHDREKGLVVNGSCQVCLVKRLKDDLTNITKVIQDRNEHLTTKLKARRMRSFFERQMLD